LLRIKPRLIKLATIQLSSPITKDPIRIVIIIILIQTTCLLNQRSQDILRFLLTWRL
jgi:hypothetical protein